MGYGKIICGHCNSTIELTTTIIPHSVKGDSFEFVKAFLYDTDVVRVRWCFDEQQADALHHSFTIPKLKAELRELLKRVGEAKDKTEETS